MHCTVSRVHHHGTHSKVSVTNGVFIYAIIIISSSQSIRIEPIISGCCVCTVCSVHTYAYCLLSFVTLNYILGHFVLDSLPFTRNATVCDFIKNKIVSFCLVQNIGNRMDSVESSETILECASFSVLWKRNTVTSLTFHLHGNRCTLSTTLSD